jgi:D-aminoacyl-tRNA deacylase
MVVFPCRHEAKAALPWFGGHFTGTLQDGHSLFSAAAPSGLRSFLQNIAALAPAGYIVSAEATHHGPVDMRTPCFFAEIGSTREQWCDKGAGVVVARAIMALQPEELPVFLGFGGGHYVQRQTELIFGTAIAFGHLFSNYQVAELNRDIVDDARQKSGATYAYLDRKSLRSEYRKKIAGILEELDLPALRSREIRSQFPHPKKE